jgi:glycogen synthase
LPQNEFPQILKVALSPKQPPTDGAAARQSPVRILFWSDLFWPYIGGSEIFAAKLLLALSERHEFMVVTRQDRPDLPSADFYGGIAIRRFPFCAALAGRDVRQVIDLRRQVTALKENFASDLVHVHNFGPSVLFHLETGGAVARRRCYLLFR